jgi:tripartite-type tricarboxylate transporter receptor subunit TctC
MPIRKITALIILLAAPLAIPSLAAAQSPAQFYQGKTISLYIGYGAGGGYDIYGRLVARFLGHHIPGQPTVVPQNMPGAGSIRAANYIYNVAPKDGTALGIVTQTVALEEILGTAGVQYKAADFRWIGRVTSNMDVLVVWHASKVKSIEDAMAHEIPLAGPGSGLFIPRILNNVVGTKFKVITGFSGSNESMLAMERGEVEAVSTSWTQLKTSKEDWLKNKTVKIVVEYAPRRSPELSDVPSMVELAKTDGQKQILSLYATASEVGRSIFTTPNVPPDRVQALRDAFEAMVRDPKFLAYVKQTGAEFDPMPGAELQKMIDQAGAIPADIRQRAVAAQK